MEQGGRLKTDFQGFRRPPFIRRPKKRDKAAVSAVYGIKYPFCLIKSI